MMFARVSLRYLAAHSDYVDGVWSMLAERIAHKMTCLAYPVSSAG